MEKHATYIFVMIGLLCVDVYGKIGDNTHLLNEDRSIAKPENPEILNKNDDVTKAEISQNIADFSVSNFTEIDKNYKSIHPAIRFRYIPFLYPRDSLKSEIEPTCLESSSDDFPKDLFSMSTKRNGAIVLHFILAIYCFMLLAVVCNDYFLPAVELICDKLNLSQDVAAATFMAIATSAPEFFVNVVGTFVTESDIGVGTIVGSSMFNTLGVAGLGGLACKSGIRIDWWPITRDSIIYVCTVTMLVVMARDEKIQWYEAMILLIFYIIYFVIMWQNQRIYKAVAQFGKMFKRKNSMTFATEPNTSEIFHTKDIEFIKAAVISVEEPAPRAPELKKQDSFLDDEPLGFFYAPKGGILLKTWWLFSWPVRLILKCTIPDCRKYNYLFPLTFIMCIVWIGSNSYLVSWMITIIGATLKVPDFVMGVTFLAAGGCLPEAISIVIVARRGLGGMGVSNSLGANTLDILLCLGLPWFIKTMVTWNQGGSNYIKMNSDSLFYTIIALILAVLVLYVTVSIAGYRLNKKVGFFLMLSYIIFLAVAIALEMFMYYEGKLLPCDYD